MLDVFLQYDFTMATYWVPDLPDIEGFSGHLWHSILIFANNTLCAWSSKNVDMVVKTVSIYLVSLR